MDARATATRSPCLVLLALTTLCGAPLHRLKAQGPALEGRVCNSDGFAVPGTLIRVVGTELGAYADSLGRFRIERVQPGRLQLTAQFVGYRPTSVDTSVAAGHTALRWYPRLTPVVFPVGTPWAGMSGSDLPHRGQRHRVACPDPPTPG